MYQTRASKRKHIERMARLGVFFVDALGMCAFVCLCYMLYCVGSVAAW
jgi:hypothetical protein